MVFEEGDEMSVRIYHNPRCSKSRETLQLIEERAIEPEIVKYLETPPSVAELDQILTLLGVEPQALMRKKEAEYKEAGLDQAGLTRAEQIVRMVAYPKVIERPIVVNGERAVLGRPPQQVLEIL
jgi:arsenate reductase